MVLRGALWPILIALGLGVPAALLAGHLMASQLYEVGGYDPLALVSATLVLGLCATAAGFIPAQCAASIEPMQALRGVACVVFLLLGMTSASSVGGAIGLRKARGPVSGA